MHRATLSPFSPFLLFTLLLAGCEESILTVEHGIGPDPVLPEPDPPKTPIINVSRAVGWPEGATPTAAPGLRVREFATDLDHPRWLYTLPNGDVLVAETNAPPRPRVRGPVEGTVVNVVKDYIGTGGESANRITLLRDADGDGHAEVRRVFLDNQHSPFGMALVDDRFYVGNTDALWRYSYDEDAGRVTDEGQKVADLPAGEINYHWTKNVVPSPDGGRLFVTVGSNSNIGERGMEEEEMRAAVLSIDPGSGEIAIYAEGLRNPNGMAIQPDSGELWVTVNERDNLGNDLVPDYMTSVREGAFYGWPWSYFGQHEDPRVEPRNPAMVEKAVRPDYALGPHTAPLGLVFYQGEAFPEHYRHGAFVALHGSYNRIPKSGYKVIFIPFEDGEPNGLPEDIMSGFLTEGGDAQGRPAGLAVAADGGLLVADDIGNKIWHIAPADGRDLSSR